MTYEQALNFDQKWTAKQAFNDLEWYLLRQEPPAMKAVALGMQALEKQMPKKPTFEGDGYDDSGNIIYDTWICPCCGDRYEVDYDRHNHCPTCGQTIDWSEED